jgi:anti-sigma B factor antagonist
MTEQEWMQIRERHAGTVAVVDVIGRMVLTEGEIDSLLRDRVADLITQGHQNIVVNLSQVTQVDTSGLKQLLAARLAVNRLGGHLRLANATKRIRDLLGITRLNTLFEIFDSEQAAIDSFATRSDAKT